MKNANAFVHCILPSPCADHASVEALFNKGFHFRGVVALDELSNPGFRCILGANTENVGVGTVWTFPSNAILGGNETGWFCVTGIDGGCIKVIKTTR